MAGKEFVRYHLRRIKPLGLVRRTMVRVLVMREHLVPTDDPAQGSAAVLANAGPCSIGKKTEIGPDVSGSPANHSTIDCPHLRAATVAIPMSK